MSETVLVVAVHPDDETLGCGGAILRHVARGDRVHWMICTALDDGDGWSAERIARRAGEIEAVAEHFGFAGVHALGFPTTRLDEVPRSLLVEAMGKVVAQVRPRVVYLPFRSDVHSDHRVAYEAAFSCTKPFRYPSVERVLMMETLSETDCADAAFAPNVYVDVTAHMDAKVEAMGLYAGELGEHPFPRSERGIRALGTLRGATCGVQYAEAFMLLRDLER